MKKTKCLIIGGDSLIGKYLFKNLKKNKFIIYKTSRKKKFKKKKTIKTIYFNLKNIKNLVFLKKFNSIIICAGINGIENCEANKKLSQNINVKATAKIINYLNKNSIHYIFFSTTQVYEKPYLKNFDRKKLKPKNLYGMQKMIIEKKINKRFGLIIRPAKIVVKNSDIFFQRFIDKKNKILKVKSNYKVFFSDIEKLTAKICNFLIQKKTGIINFSSKKKFTIYFLAKNYLRNFKKYKIIFN
jgi:dTDP-4-dehydrorhamnose reductase